MTEAVKCLCLQEVLNNGQNDEKSSVSSFPSRLEKAFSKLSEDHKLKIERATPARG